LRKKYWVTNPMNEARLTPLSQLLTIPVGQQPAPVLTGTLDINTLAPTGQSLANNAKIFIGFTAATGSAWARHEVRNISINAPAA
jgi:hypothetical protein